MENISKLIFKNLTLRTDEKHNSRITGLGTELQPQDIKIRIPSTLCFNDDFCLIGYHRVSYDIVSLLHWSGERNSEHFVWLICPFQRLLRYGTVVTVVPGGVQNTWLGNRKIAVAGKNTEHSCSLNHLSKSKDCRDFQIINKHYALLAESSPLDHHAINTINWKAPSDRNSFSSD